MNYKDYVNKYLLSKKENGDFFEKTNLLLLEDFFKNNSNYKIYHSLDDYLTNQSQLKKLKVCTGKNTTILSNGAHLGFLYTKQFLNDLKREIQLTSKTALNE